MTRPLAKDNEQVRRGWTGPRPPVSIVVLTLNERVNIADCLESCDWCDDVHVLDSGSTDGTRELAESLGAGVHVNRFESFGKQRNWAIDHIPLKNDWVFHLDADERFTPELVKEIAELLREDPPFDGFHVPHKLMFMGRWLKRAGGYPTYQMRLFHKSRMRFIDHGHGQREAPETRVGKLCEPYLHHVFSKGLYDWLDKHNRYSSLEALQVIKQSRFRTRLGDLHSSDPVRRRRAWKELGYRLPARPALRVFMTLFVLGGIFEGRAAITYARLLAMYEEMITLKLRLLRKRAAVGVDFERDASPEIRTEAFDAEDLPTLPPPVRSSASPHAVVDPGPQTEALLDDEHGQLLPEASPWSFKEQLLRAVWMIGGKPIFRISFHNWYGFRAWLLRMFGAKIGKGVRVRPSVNVEIPWNIELRDGAVVGDYAILYSLGKITVGERTIISQYAHLCAGTHDHTDRRFPLIRDPITVGADAWVGADAFVGPNVRIGRLSVLGARSSAYKDCDAETVYVGNPARPIKKRELHALDQESAA